MGDVCSVHAKVARAVAGARAHVDQRGGRSAPPPRGAGVARGGRQWRARPYAHLVVRVRVRVRARNRARVRVGLGLGLGLRLRVRVRVRLRLRVRVKRARPYAHHDIAHIVPEQPRGHPRLVRVRG